MLRTPLLTLAVLFVGQPAPAEFYQDLRDERDVRPGIKMIGPYLAKYTFPEKEGLRVFLPTRREWPGAVGLETEFTISGDFEITGTYEILAVDMPARAGASSGVNLWIRQGNDDSRVAQLGRSFSRNQGHRYAALHTDRRRPRATQTANRATNARAGQLRLVRQGNTLAYQFADESTEGMFQQLFTADIGADDVTLVRFVVNTSEEFNAIEARLIDLRIRGSGGVPNLPADEVAGRKPRPWSCGAAALIGSVLLALATAYAVARYRHRRIGFES